MGSIVNVQLPDFIDCMWLVGSLNLKDQGKHLLFHFRNNDEGLSMIIKDTATGSGRFMGLVSNVHQMTTDMRFIFCTWFGEFCFCCSLTALPGPAWVLLTGFANFTLKSGLGSSNLDF